MEAGLSLTIVTMGLVVTKSKGFKSAKLIWRRKEGKING